MIFDNPYLDEYFPSPPNHPDVVLLNAASVVLYDDRGFHDGSLRVLHLVKRETIDGFEGRSEQREGTNVAR